MRSNNSLYTLHFSVYSNERQNREGCKRSANLTLCLSFGNPEISVGLSLYHLLHGLDIDVLAFKNYAFY
jgi:hypothetical protein